MEKSDIHHLALNVRQEISHDDFDNHAYFPNLIFLLSFFKSPRKSHDDAERQLSSLAFARDRVDPKRHVGTRYDPSRLRSRPERRDRGVLPRSVRQDPRQPRAGEQVVEARLQACRRVPSQVRLRRVPGHGFWDAEYSCLTPAGQRRSSVSALRESRRTSW